MEQQSSDDTDSFQFPHHHLHNNSSSQFHNQQEQPQMFAQEEEEESSQMLSCNNPFFQFHGGDTTTSRTSNMNGFHSQTQALTPWNPSSYYLGQNNNGDLRLIAAQLEHKPIMIRTPGLPNDIDELSVSAQNGKLTENGGGLVENGGGLVENGRELTENGGGILTENGLIDHSRKPPPQQDVRRKRKMEEDTAAAARLRLMDQKRQQKTQMETRYNKLLDAVNEIYRRWIWMESQFRELTKRVENEAIKQNHFISWIKQRDAIIASKFESITSQKIHLPPSNLNFMNNNNGSVTTAAAAAAATSTNAQLYHHHHQQYIQVQHPQQPYQPSVIAAPFVNVMSPSQSPARSNAEPGYTNSGTIMINTNNGMIDQNSNRWAEDETHTLIEIRSSMEPNFNEPIGSKTALWKEISEKMKSIGYVGRTGNKCKEKWENCQKYYRKYKEEDKVAEACVDNGGGAPGTESARKRARHSRTQSYFKLFDEYYANYEWLETVGGAGCFSENENGG